MGSRGSIGRITGLAVAAIVAAATPAMADGRIQAPAGGQVRALVVGIDDYANVRRLKGAAADARDLGQALRRAGVPAANMTVMLDQDVTRAALIGAMSRLVAQAKADDLVILSFAGHGAQAREKVKGSKPDGMDEVYVLRNYDAKQRTGSPEIVIGPEIKHWLLQLENKGVDVVFVADTCHGGGLTRSVDPRSGEESYRKMDLAAEAAEQLQQPVSQPSDAFRDQSSFKRVTFLAAVDRRSLAPEVDIPGQATKRGALSYSVARAIERAATSSGEGGLTRGELFAYARQTVAQYAHQKQVIVTEPVSSGGALGVAVWRFGGAERTVAAVTPVVVPAAPVIPTEPAAPARAPDKPPVRIAIVNGAASALANIKPLFTPFIVAASPSDADVVWDAQAKEAVVAGDIIARAIAADGVPALADRVRALAEIAKLSEGRTQTVELLPNNKLHHRNNELSFVAPGLRGKYAIIFNLTGAGKIQFLFPNEPGRQRPESPKIDANEWTLGFRVTEPYGADTVVVISSDQRLEALENQLRALHLRDAAGLLPDLLGTLAPRASARIGFTSVFTAP